MGSELLPLKYQVPSPSPITTGPIHGRYHEHIWKGVKEWLTEKKRANQVGRPHIEEAMYNT